MTSNEIAPRAGSTLAPAQVTQATAVEQARAAAEVQAAVVVAQNCPRDLARAQGEMRDTCGRTALAARAFYSVPRKGAAPVTGASIHLARELARIWGNLDYGVREMSRDDDAGMSEIQAFAWDQQTNVRTVRSFQVPHQRMARGQRTPIFDLNEVYLNNQNIGARAVRECIFALLPPWFTEAAQDACRRTLEEGEGVPLSERIEKMIAAFAGIDVTVGQLETRTGRKRGQWTAGDVAKLGIDYTSITRDGLDQSEVFPPAESDTLAALKAQAPADGPMVSRVTPEGADPWESSEPPAHVNHGRG